MNVGYLGILNDNEKMENAVCPLCGSNIHVSKTGADYACVSKECPLYNGAGALIRKIEKVIVFK